MAKKKSDPKKELEKLTFEQAIGALTQIVEKIETGQVPLQESIEQYEKGMELIGRCREILVDAEKKIEEIESKNQKVLSADEPEGEEGDEDEEEGLF